MQIGRRVEATTSISTADADSITVRGHDLTSELMGQVSFTEYFFLLTSGKLPDENQKFFLDLLLVAIAEHGLVPTNQVSRMTYAADPDFLQGAVAAGLLGCGKVILGTTEIAGAFLSDSVQRIEAQEKTIDDIVLDMKASGARLPGFGHPLHKPVDPRAEKILELAEARGAAGRYVSLARDTQRAVNEHWGKPLPMNVSFAIPAVLLDLDFPSSVLKGIPILARTASLLAHLGEESDKPIGFALAHFAEQGVTFKPGEQS